MSAGRGVRSGSDRRCLRGDRASPLASIRALALIALCWAPALAHAQGEQKKPATRAPQSAPPPAVIALAAGSMQSLALRSDGSIIVWGSNEHELQSVPPLPKGATYVEIAAGFAHCLARRSDGQVIAWGSNDFNQCEVPSLPKGLSYVEVAAAGNHSLARRSDGSVVAWGDSEHGLDKVPGV